MAQQIQFRRDTSANWTLNNPILAEGEMGLELNTKRYKIGDGINQWEDLDYVDKGNVIGPNISVDGNIVLFDGITGELIKDSGLNISELSTLQNHNDFNGLQGGDSTSQEYYHLTLNEINKLVDSFEWIIADSNITTESNKNYLIDLSTDNLILNLPANPSSNDLINFYKLDNNLINNYTLTLRRNGKSINGFNEDLVLNYDEIGFNLLFIEKDNNWIFLNKNSVDGGYF